MGPSCQQSSSTVSEDAAIPGEEGISVGPDSGESRALFSSQASAAGLLLIELSGPRPAARGRLAFFIDGAIERALDARGAPAPRVSATTDFELSLADQIERAHVSGAAGIALWFGPLHDIARAGVLDCEDSSAVRRLVRAAREDHVRVGFDPTNYRLYAYSDPQPFDALIARSPEPLSEASAISSPEPEEAAPIIEAEEPVIAKSETPEIETEAPEAETAEDSASDVSSESTAEVDDDALLAESARAMAEEMSGDDDTEWLREALIELSTPKPRPAIDAAPALGLTALEETLDESRARVEDVDTDGDMPEATPASVSAPLPFHIAFAEAVVEPPKPTVNAELKKRLEACARELEFANGPKPLAVVERLFASAYVPIRAALDRGADLPSVAETADEWAKSFEKSYLEAFDALRMRNKRPKMIPDLPDIALRIGRLHGARSVQLLLVDGMRFDLGECVHEKLRDLAGQRAACAERLTVWSALPTKTSTQVELLGRGVPGLREFTGEVSEDMVVARGRKASMIRRLKAGHREVLKLDVVEARLAEPGSVTADRLDQIADEVSQRVAGYFEDLQPRTLVVVFGDHGFRLTRSSEGLVTASQGGASPEEVLVPAFAWLVGAVH
jgi:hypothetical protein